VGRSLYVLLVLPPVPPVNGFNGGTPVRHAADLAALSRMGPRSGPRLVSSHSYGRLYAIVHRAAYEADGGMRVVDWLRPRGAGDVGRFGADLLFELPGRGAASAAAPHSVQ
jgi:hypothetical protein